MQTSNNEIRTAGLLHGAHRPLLIVDDDELELCLLADRLGAAGFDVQTAQNGEEARKMLSTGAFPVVITDYQMPVMDGLALVEDVRARHLSNSYFIMWSIRADEADRERGFSRGVDDYVSKASTDRELLAHIEAGFNTVEMRRSLLKARKLRTDSVLNDVQGDGDAWNAAATRLHAEIMRARRYQRPLTVMMLQIERALLQPETTCLAPAKLECLLGSIASSIRRGVDWVMPLDASSGLARVMVAFPETNYAQVRAIRARFDKVLTELAITDEFAQLMPDCSVGVASVDIWHENIAINAATMVAAAEQRLEKLSQVEH